MPSSSFVPPSLMLFSPLSFFHSQKANDWLSTQITPFPLVYPEPTRQPPHSPTVSLPSISAKVCLLMETILSLEALLKERTPTSPSSQLSPLFQPSHPPPLLYYQADPHLPDPLPIFCILHWQGAVIFTTGLASFPITNNIYSALETTPKQCPPSPTDTVEPIPSPTPASSTTSMDNHLHPPQVIPSAITIPAGPSDLGPIIPAQYFTCQSTKHLCPNYSHHCCSSCRQTAPSHPNYKCSKLHCSHCEQHGHSHILCSQAMSPNYNPFMDATWDLFHYKVNKEDRSSWDGTSRLWGG